MRDICWLPIVHAGEEWLVSSVYVSPVGIGEAIKIATENGCELPSPALVDTIWAAADLKLPPLPRKHDGTPRMMASAETYQDPERRIREQINGRAFTLLAGTHKDVVTSNGRVGLYGWHQLNGRVIQPFFGGHALAWKDYSQGLRLVRRVT
jgi:hypothetical protein